jgi:adenine-specific DNA-methyltransferase
MPDPWFLDDDAPVAVLWDTQKAEAWLDALAEADHVTEPLRGDNGNTAVQRDQGADSRHARSNRHNGGRKATMAAGFAANLAYFKLEFLEPTEVAMGRQFAAILPVLWMMAGAQGPRPQAPDPHAHWLIPVGCPFAVLLRETRFREFLAKIETRADLTHLFLVTNSESAFHDMHAALPQGLTAIQLYKNYLDNFKINTPRG